MIMNVVHILMKLWCLIDEIVLLMMHCWCMCIFMMMMLHDEVHACIVGCWSRTSVQWWDFDLIFDVETHAQEGYDPMMRGSRFYDGNLGVVNLKSSQRVGTALCRVLHSHCIIWWCWLCCFDEWCWVIWFMIHLCWWLMKFNCYVYYC